ncbi:MAG: hypothetical protein D3912_14245, partial [Candidatus Electrothrix sp. AX1]|nr:hypothetical protein [Candidatus Electrothrix sp. AX1]
HPKTQELANRLLGFKDLFLICFFLNIGISGSPTLSGIIIALLVLLFLMPLFCGLNSPCISLQIMALQCTLAACCL